MNRLIPGKTKVQIELFRGVTIGDVVIAGTGMVMLVLVLLSSLPHKLGFCIGVVSAAALLRSISTPCSRKSISVF